MFGYAQSYSRITVTSKTKITQDLIPYVEKINGVNKKFFVGKKLIIPKDLTSARSYCPVDSFRFDLVSKDSIIVIDRSKNVFAVYEQGWLVRWGPITRARRINNTPSGAFHIQHKWRLIYSKKYGNVPMPYALHIKGNVCMHQGPMVGYPASHGCVRLFKDDAIWLYNWARVGTAVIIQ